MIPGPVEVEPEVLVEMSKPIVVHYGPEWTAFYKETLELMKQVMLAERSRLFFIAGPGTAALDASIGNVIGDGKKILVLANGYFGDRLVKISESYTSAENVILLDVPMGESINPDDVEEILKSHPDIAAVALVHCETSTGVLNPVKEIASLCHQYDAISILDAVTALGAVEFRFDDWGVDICITSSQKSLGLFPGIAPVAISPRAWDVIENTKSPGWYLNFKTWQSFMDNWGEWHPHPVTMPSNLLQTLNASCKAILAEGLESRWQRHIDVSTLFRQGLQNLGYQPLASGDAASPTITPVWIDDRIAAVSLIEYLKEHHQILISGGLDELSGKIFRVGHMGPTAYPHNVLPLLFGIEEALRYSGAPIEQQQSLIGLNA